ncbi:hypothetical protein ILYODFUR_027414 [Ilyodon furcidens]|uniref:Uncharacterized protein n=1 Tax=Ilyodon furcidens TaxID=33524 RepID=A0ABV0VHM9_9TELE
MLMSGRVTISSRLMQTRLKPTFLVPNPKRIEIGSQLDSKKTEPMHPKKFHQENPIPFSVFLAMIQISMSFLKVILTNCSPGFLKTFLRIYLDFSCFFNQFVPRLEN